MTVQKATPIIFTSDAAARVKDLLSEEENPNLKLRAYITGGGCSGFQYGFTFDDETADDDTLITTDDVTLAVDAMSFQYLAGATIDYVKNVDGEQFVIKNPNAKTTCGCGSSFSVGDD